MNKLFKKFRYLFFSLVALSTAFITISVIPTNYDLTVPAGVTNVNTVYSFKGIDTSDVNVYSVAVYSYYNVSTLNYILAKMNPYSIIEEHNEYVNTSISYSYASGTIQRNVSLTNALIAGYKEAGRTLDYEFKGNIIHSVYGKDEVYFKPGDIVTQVEGVPITEENDINRILISKYHRYEDGYYYLDLKLDQEISFKIIRNKEEKEITTKPFLYEYGNTKAVIIGIGYYKYYNVLRSSADPEYGINDPDTFGPSAGLMQSLFIYDSISGEKLTKGLTIVGTGTIDADGNVGAIGGVEAKIVSAALANCDIFFVPKDNYEEALSRYNKLGFKMKLVSVSTLKDVINYLREYKGIS